MSSTDTTSSPGRTIVRIPGFRELSAGTNFLFLRPDVTPDKGVLDDLIAQCGASRTFPLWDRSYSLDGVMLTGPRLAQLDLAGLSTDKDVYREGDDVTTILLVDPARPDEDVAVEVQHEHRTFRKFGVHLDWNGMATVTLHDLAAGSYEVQAGAARTTFDVVAYALAPMSAAVQEAKLQDGKLECTLELSSLARPVTGRVRVVVMENGREVYGPVQLDSIDGVLQAAFPLVGDGPFVAHVTGVDDPGLDTQIPLRGTARTERELTWVSRLGAEVAASLLTLDGGRQCRGLWLRKEGANNEPVLLDEPVADVGRITARVALSDVVLTVLHTGERRVQHRMIGVVEAGQTLEFGVQPPFSVAALGGFVGDQPWEGTACLLPPGELGLELVSGSRAKPRSRLPVTIRTRRSGEASVYLVVRDARLAPMGHPLVRLGTALKTEIARFQAPGKPISSHGNFEMSGSRATRRTPDGGPLDDFLRRSRLPGPRSRMTLGEAFVANGFISQEQLKEAIARQKRTGQHLGQILLEMRVVTERDITEVLSWQLNVPYIDLGNYIIDPAIAKLVPEHIALRHQLIPINRVGNKLTVAMVDPLNVLALDDIQLMTGLTVKAVVASPTDVRKALGDTYGAHGQVGKLMGEIGDIGQDMPRQDDLESMGELGENDAPIIRLVNLILNNAVDANADSILIEPTAREITVRYVIGQEAHIEMTPPKKAQAAISCRLRALAGLPPSSEVQVGWAKLKVNDRRVDLRVTMTPGAHGENIMLDLSRPAGPDSLEAGAPVREHFPEVLFAGLVHVRGEMTLDVPLGDALGRIELDAFAMHQGDWESASRQVEVSQTTFGEMTLPEFVHPGDAVVGRLDVGWSSTPVEIVVTRDGQPVQLATPSGPLDLGSLTGFGRATLTFPAGPGSYECRVREATTGDEDRSARHVTPPGTFRALTRTLRMLMPGESLSAEESGALFLKVLPGPERPFREVCEATADYSHLCCEQTAAKLLAAFGAYLTSESRAQRERLESSILAGIERELGLWVRDRGLRMYPGDRDVSEHWGRAAVEHLLAVPVLREGGQWPRALSDAIRRIEELTTNLVAPCRIEARPTRIASTYDSYRAVVSGSLSTATVIRALDDRLRSVPGSASGGHGEVMRRVEACHAAAALMRIGTGETVRRALELVDTVGRERQAEGAYYSTHDSAAAILMLHELVRLGQLGASTVSVNGRKLRTDAAAALTDEVDRVEALDSPVLVEVGRITTNDWTKFRSTVPVSVQLSRPDRGQRIVSGDRLELRVELKEYMPGDLAHICLPPCLARISGGGRVQSFGVDFEGRTSVTVPVAAVGTTGGTGTDSQHYFVCVRNMFESERVGNPGLLAVTVTP